MQHTFAKSQNEPNGEESTKRLASRMSEQGDGPHKDVDAIILIQLACMIVSEYDERTSSICQPGVFAGQGFGDTGCRQGHQSSAFPFEGFMTNG